ncbi:MAG: 4Fe-4S binding protein [Melioribacteraceae bacterium]|nr:4Fe-4S binding protein [Melioribacteraceae bacterium]MCF8354130.1 4Fe-4S binding protein [Melioribacteraceae bacterium]MCF8393357.1 4Fe-4S binding protein [Melioribacteraceae bacterium]MCF8418922.1 4Fe-4S binding protein [Melioribacteraceae bacterium]
MIREIIKIDEHLCDGCGDCVPSCREGALQVIDGKVRLISDLFCDGLGACIGHCPQDALTIEKREAEPYNETKVMDYIVKGGPNVIKAHLEHLIDHNELDYVTEAIEYLNKNEIPIPELKREKAEHSGCPGSKEMEIDTTENISEAGARQSHLANWPIQLHLANPNAAYFKNSDLLLSADCCGFSYPDFHKDFLKGKSLIIACPKLDTNKQSYFDKLISMMENSNLNSITILVMQVPCCSGLVQMVQQAVEISGCEIPVHVKVIGIDGTILKEAQIN